MLNKKILYSYNDVMIQPAVISEIEHRSECNVFLEDGKLPIFTAPMSTVVNEKNYDIFEKNGINAIMPRNISLDVRLDYARNGKWAAFSLSEFEQYFCNEEDNNVSQRDFKVLIDIANGHMKKMYDLVKKSKAIYGSHITIMVGNIANPKTYEYAYEAGVDMIRVIIGSGNGCTTSSNLGIHYGCVSLLDEIFHIKSSLNFDAKIRNKTLPKIVADGGIRNYSDVIKPLALGADYVMIGSVFASLIESAATTFTYDGDNNLVSFKPLEGDDIREFGDGMFDLNDGEHILNKLYKIFYGMASRDGQIAINGVKTKTAEGIRKIIPVTTNIDKWVDNMISFLRSAMSYTNIKDIKNFNPINVDCNIISFNARESINK